MPLSGIFRAVVSFATHLVFTIFSVWTKALPKPAPGTNLPMRWTTLAVTTPPMTGAATASK